jgi:DNA-binding protein
MGTRWRVFKFSVSVCNPVTFISNKVFTPQHVLSSINNNNNNNNNIIMGARGSVVVKARYWLLVAVLTVQFVPHRKHTPSP